MTDTPPDFGALHEQLVREDTDSRFWLGVARALVWAGFLAFMLLAALVVMPK